MALARTREALHNGWDKNDPKDAQVILHMLQDRRVRPSTATQAVAGLNDLQELSKTHDMVSRAKTELWHRLLTHYLPLYFPEVERFQGNSRSDWFLALLEQFPTPASITPCPRKRSWRPRGRWLAGRSPRHACWPISTRRRGPPWHCRYGLIHRRSRCSGMVLAEGRSLIRQRDQIEAQAEALLASDADYRAAAPAARHRPDQRADHIWPKPAIFAASAIIASS